MVSNLIFIAQLNIIFSMIMLFFWNRPLIQIPKHQAMTAFIGFNIVVGSLILITGYSYADTLQNIYAIFDTSDKWYRFAIPALCVFLVTLVIAVYQHLQLLKSPENRKYLWVIGIFLIVTIGIWLPFSLELLPQLDNWGLKHFLVEGYWGEGDLSKAKEVATRVSLMLTTTLGHLIDQQGYFGSNIIYVVFIFLKGLLVYGILRKFKIVDHIGLMVALIFMIYPSTEPVMSLRNFTVLSGILMFLASIYYYLRYEESPTRTNLFIFYVFMFVSVTSHEYALLHILAFPLLIFFRTRLWNQRISLSLIWSLIPVLYVLYYGSTALFAQGTPYGVGYVDDHSQTNLFQYVLEIFSYDAYSYGYLLPYAWKVALSFVTTEFIVLTFAVTGIVVTGIYFAIKQIQSVTPPNKGNNRQLMILGFIILGLAGTIFAATKRWDFEWRIYSVGSLGAAIMLVVMVEWIAGRLSRQHRQHVTIGIFAVLFFIAYASTLTNHQLEQTASRHKENLIALASSLEESNPDSTWIYLYDMSEEEYSKLFPILNAERYIRAAFNIVIKNGMIGQNFYCGREVIGSKCTPTADGLDINFEDVRASLSYEDIVFIWIDEDGTTTLVDDFPDEYLGVENTITSYNPNQHIVFK